MYVPHTLSTYVSFSVEDASLPFEDVEQLVLERHDTLAELNLQVLGLSQGRLCHLHGDVSYDILLATMEYISSNKNSLCMFIKATVYSECEEVLH